jgi:hypothetical protein
MKRVPLLIRWLGFNDIDTSPHLLNPLKPKLANIQEFSPYLRENTTFFLYKDQLVNVD